MSRKTKKARLWELLVSRGEFADRKSAEGWIMAGKVLVDDRVVDKAGELVPKSSEVRIKGKDRKYVSRGGPKLESGLSAFGIDVSGRVVLDVGASTGGFADCLLQHGASKVYAVDVGYGQLAGSLRVDPRVVNMERTNISDVRIEQLQPVPTLATLDFSYLSLADAIPIVVPLLDSQGELVCLVKPLFEVEDSEMRRTGRIDDPRVYDEVIEQLVLKISDMGLRVAGIVPSSIDGSKGTKEFFLRVLLSRSKADEIDRPPA
jgi:23S rRNA (cytidine1920-2'-O)/16S rRNA (cytidine1409-2'-O)-methyltransferase